VESGKRTGNRVECRRGRPRGLRGPQSRSRGGHFPTAISLRSAGRRLDRARRRTTSHYGPERVVARQKPFNSSLHVLVTYMSRITSFNFVFRLNTEIHQIAWDTTVYKNLAHSARSTGGRLQTPSGRGDVAAGNDEFSNRLSRFLVSRRACLVASILR
jgi:hypothetical protein